MTTLVVARPTWIDAFRSGAEQAMALNRLLDDPEVHALISRVEEAYGPDAVGKAIERTLSRKGAVCRQDDRQESVAGR